MILAVQQPRLQGSNAELTIRVFGVQLVISTARPGQEVIVTTVGHTIVANTHYLVLLIHDTGTNLKLKLNKSFQISITMQTSYVQEKNSQNGLVNELNPFRERSH